MGILSIQKEQADNTVPNLSLWLFSQKKKQDGSQGLLIRSIPCPSGESTLQEYIQVIATSQATFLEEIENMVKGPRVV